MAFLLKPGRVLIDQYNNVYTTAYAVIDVSDGDKSRGEQSFRIDVYKDKTTRNSKKTPIFSYVGMAKEQDFIDYFSVNTLSTSDPYKQTYLYVTTAGQVSGFNVDDYDADVVILAPQP